MLTGPARSRGSRAGLHHQSPESYTTEANGCKHLSKTEIAIRELTPKTLRPYRETGTRESETVHPWPVTSTAISQKLLGTLLLA